METGDLARNIYVALTDEEDARACRDISDSACRESPQNFLLILLSNFLSKLGDAVANPKTTLAWVAGATGAPSFVVGFLVPIRESGSLIPQLAIASYIRRLPVRKWVWVVGSVVQAAAVAGLGLVAWQLQGAAAGWAILSLLVVFSLARGFCSVASKDVLGKTVPKNRRGQLTGWSASAAGLITIGVGVALLLPLQAGEDSALYGLMLVLAGGLWLLAAFFYSFVREYAGETEGGKNALGEAFSRLAILREDRAFRRFVIVRALLMCSALSAPFYVALAQQSVSSAHALLGLFIIADGLANLVSAPVWGRFADRSSKWVMITAVLIASGIGALTFLLDHFWHALVATYWYVPLGYFFLSIAHSGVRVGRKTYVVDLASGNRRTDYVSVSNTVIGVLLLLVGSVGALAPIISTSGVIGVLSLMGLLGAVLGTQLPEVQQEED